EPHQDQHASGPARPIAAFAEPCFEQRLCGSPLLRQSPESLQPEERIEHAWAAREQLAGVQRMTLLRHTVAQLVDPERQDPSLFQSTIDFAELLCELLALVADISALGAPSLASPRPNLLQPPPPPPLP